MQAFFFFAQLKIKKSYPVQADGEPWIQSPGDINISAMGQANMLQCSNADDDDDI